MLKLKHACRQYSWLTLRARYSCRVEGYPQTESVRVRPSVCPLLSYSTTALYRYSANYTLSACLHSCNAWRTTPFILIRLTPQNLLQTINIYCRIVAGGMSVPVELNSGSQQLCGKDMTQPCMVQKEFWRRNV